MVAPNVNAPDARARLAQARADRDADDVRINNALLPAQRQNIMEAETLNRNMLNRIPVVIQNNPDIEPALRRIFLEFRRDLNDQAAVLRVALDQNQEAEQRRVDAARGGRGAVDVAPEAPARQVALVRPAGPVRPDAQLIDPAAAGGASIRPVVYLNNDDVEERPAQRRKCQRDNSGGCGGCGR
jgi:hypothetical protein